MFLMARIVPYGTATDGDNGAAAIHQAAANKQKWDNKKQVATGCAG
jgi:hypothetical protein